MVAYVDWFIIGGMHICVFASKLRCSRYSTAVLTDLTGKLYEVSAGLFGSYGNIYFRDFKSNTCNCIVGYVVPGISNFAKAASEPK